MLHCKNNFGLAKIPSFPFFFTHFCEKKISVKASEEQRNNFHPSCIRKDDKKRGGKVGPFGLLYSTSSQAIASNEVKLKTNSIV